MDLHDFQGESLYLDSVDPETITNLLQEAAAQYGEGGSEAYLLQAYSEAPTNLSVIVGLYRFYFYQHRYEESLKIADIAMRTVAPLIGFPEKWERLTQTIVAYGSRQSMEMVRFYLLALKGAAYLNLRLARFELGKTMLLKILELDSSNRLGAKLLLEVVSAHSADVIPFPTKRPSKEAVS